MQPETPSCLPCAREESGGRGLALVSCTGAALRRPSACLSVRHEEGCFSPATADKSAMTTVAWGNPVGRGSTIVMADLSAAGPLAFQIPGPVVAKPPVVPGQEARKDHQGNNQ